MGFVFDDVCRSQNCPQSDNIRRKPNSTVKPYDFFRNPVEAKDLIIQALEIQPFPQSSVWDGELDGRMVKIMPVNRIATKADLEELKANLPYKTYEKRKAESPMQPVEKITIVCMGHEPDLKASLEQELSEYKLDIEIVDILRDKKDLQLKREAEAEIAKEGNKLVIRSFYPMNLMQKLSLQKEYVEDWRQLVESIMIDWNYDGVVMQPAVTDVPGKNEIVSGIYDIPEDAGTIRVKIRQLTNEQLKATIFLSKENYDTLDDELRKNYNMEISDFGKSPNTNKKIYKVRVLPPPRSIKMKRLWHEYSLVEKEYSLPIDFHLSELDESKYEAKMYEKGSLRLGLSEKETNIDSMKDQERFSEFSLTAEISRYMNVPCLTIAKILQESVDTSANIVEAVNRHNEILEDVIIPEIFHTLYEVKSVQKSEDVDMVLLREPKDAGYYEFSASDELVITKGHNNFTPQEEAKSFHADTYCFDSKPERECFLQYISSNKVKEIYFTGMFTSNQGDLSVQYYDPESKRLRKYYPDFLALMEDGSYQLIEVKGDNKIDDEVVLAKKAAAEEMAVASGVHYLMYAGSTLMKTNVLESALTPQQQSTLPI